jgi:O-antigen ligase
LGPLAQSVEQRTFNPWVVGSIPTGPTHICDELYSRIRVPQTIVQGMRFTLSSNKPTQLALIAVATTVAVNPWTAYDPINLSKLLVISTGAAYLLVWVIVNLKRASRSDWSLMILVFMFFSSLVISFFSNLAPWYQQFWGIWGRATGLLAYSSFLVILIAAHLMASTQTLKQTRIIFERTGYFIALYTLLQLLELDPINWSQKLMVATLGNINFMSSFLGLAAISYSSRFLIEKSNVSSKLFFMLMSFLNIYLILVSKSIQGIGVYFAGLALLATFVIRRKSSFIRSIFFLITSIFLGVFALAGTAGIGPLSLIKQETVQFRIDYWQSGINMLTANPLNGVGIDSYGDYYRQYRSLEAVTRTGPQRVTNTAHNIFLDVFTGAGLIAGLLFLSIMLLTALAVLKSLKLNTKDNDFSVFAALWLGFIVFCLISINQIGVGVWGFLFTGLITGSTAKYQLEFKFSGKQDRLSQYKIGKVYADKNGRSEISVKNLHNSRPIEELLSALLATTMFITTLIPNLIDARFLAAVKKSDLSQALELVNRVGAQDFHKEQLISRLAQQGNEVESLELALSTIKTNPRNWAASVEIIVNKSASREQKSEAAKRLVEMDPNNQLLREDVKDLLYP